MNRKLLQDIQGVKNSEIIFSPTYTKKKDDIYVEDRGKESNSQLTVRSANATWVPYKGALEINQAYVLNEFYFNDVMAFNANRTYEHETQVYDRNYADYAGYWSSNMPNAYYDTQFMDKIDIFAIGSSNTQNFRTQTKYTTYMSLKPGTASSSKVIVKGQIGHRNPNGCHSTWCIWADATSDGLTSGTAPFGISWVK